MANELQKIEFLIRDRITKELIAYYIAAANINMGDDANYISLPDRLEQMAQDIREASQSYSPPAGGIPAEQLSAEVRALLALANTALQVVDGSLDITSDNPIKNKVVAASIDSLQRAIDALTNTEDTAGIINSMDEVTAFLAGITNDQTLSGKLLELRNAINEKQAAIADLETIRSGAAKGATAVQPEDLEQPDWDESNPQSPAYIAHKPDIPTKTSELNNDSGFLTEHQDISGKADKETTYSKSDVDALIDGATAAIEEEQIIAIVGDKLSMWLDEDGESINIIAGDVPDIAAAPTISHETQTNGTVVVSIATTEQGAAIYYTTDGTTPTTASSVYSTPFTLNAAGPHTIKAIAAVADKLNSSVASETVNVLSCTAPVITVDNSARTEAVVTATAGSGESVSLSVGGQTVTGTGSVSVTINKASSTQTLTATATATATGKLSAETTQNVTIMEKVAYQFGEHSLGGKALSANSPISVRAAAEANAIFVEEDGVVYWEVDLQNKLYHVNSNYTLYNTSNNSSSIFTAGADNVLTIEHVPEELTHIRDINVFSGCTNLAKFSITHQSALTNIERSLASKTSLTEVVLPLSITALQMAFSGDTALTCVIAPGVTSLGESVFNNCSALTTINLGTITAVGKNAFNGCSQLDFANVNFSNVTTLGEAAFKSCSLLTSVTFLSDSITAIKTDTFRSCSRLSSITLPSALTSIGGTAFLYCSSLASVDIPSGITSIGGMAFQGMATGYTITIRKSINDASEAPSVTNNSFSSASAIYVPADSVEYYKEAWTDYKSKIQAISNS